MDQRAYFSEIQQASVHSAHLAHCAKEFDSLPGTLETSYLLADGTELAIAPKTFFFARIIQSIKEALASVSLISSHLELMFAANIHPDRYLLNSMCGALNVHRRKLFEAAIRIVNFRTTDLTDFYRHYLLLEELQLLNRDIKDKKTYFEKVSDFLHQPALRVKTMIVNLETSNPLLESTWYLRKRKGSDKNASLDGIELINSTAGIYKTASALLNRYEKIVIGTSYNVVFGLTSNSIHFTTSPHRINKHNSDLKTAKYCNNLCLMAQYLIIECFHVLKPAQAPLTTGVQQALDSTEETNRKITSQLLFKQFEIGELVYYQGFLCEVKTSHTSSFDLTSYEIASISSRTPFIEWIPASDLFHICRNGHIEYALLDTSELRSKLAGVSDVGSRTLIINEYAKLNWTNKLDLSRFA